MNETKTLVSPACQDEICEVMDVLSMMDLGGRKTLLAFLKGAKFGLSLRLERDSA